MWSKSGYSVMKGDKVGTGTEEVLTRRWYVEWVVQVTPDFGFRDWWYDRKVRPIPNTGKSP